MHVKSCIRHVISLCFLCTCTRTSPRLEPLWRWLPRSSRPLGFEAYNRTFFISIFIWNYLLLYSYLSRMCSAWQNLLFFFVVLHPFTLQIESENIIACVAKGAKRKVFSSCLQRNVVIVVICKTSVYFADCWKFRKFAKHLDFPLFAEIKFSRFNLTWRAAAKEVNLQHALQQDKLFFLELGQQQLGEKCERSQSELKMLSKESSATPQSHLVE